LLEFGARGRDELVSEIDVLCCGISANAVDEVNR
jgi:hypothetical protein